MEKYHIGHVGSIGSLSKGNITIGDDVKFNADGQTHTLGELHRRMEEVERSIGRMIDRLAVLEEKLK